MPYVIKNKNTGNYYKKTKSYFNPRAVTRPVWTLGFDEVGDINDATTYLTEKGAKDATSDFERRLALMNGKKKGPAVFNTVPDWVEIEKVDLVPADLQKQCEVSGYVKVKHLDYQRYNLLKHLINRMFTGFTDVRMESCEVVNDKLEIRCKKVPY